jgi:8-oxo-dGTP pyrophosphatase MutT (NUDIX family)
MKIDPNDIKQKLIQNQDQGRNFCPPLPGETGSDTQPAAVLIPLLLDQNTWKLLFIKRTHHSNDRHSGQIAFPGGRSDKNDLSLKNTALREAEEEIGLKMEDVDILGQSCPITTVTDYEVTPFVGVLPWPYPLHLSRIEVEKTILIPVDWLADSNNRQTKSWKPNQAAVRGFPVIFFEKYFGEILWGATAQIVVDFLKLIHESN